MFIDNQLDPKDALLWQALETLRGLSGSKPANVLASELEKYFGVEEPEYIWCKACQNHVLKTDSCFSKCAGKE